MNPRETTQRRLAGLRERGREELAALWIEALAPQEALAELFGRRDDLSLLQKARFLLDLGRHEDAREVLGEVAAALPGLRRIRDELVAASAAPQGALEPPDAEEEPALASPTLAELHAEQGDEGAAIAIYREILARNPQDHGARRRLTELLGARRPRREAPALHAWLARVRHWRGELGV